MLRSTNTLQRFTIGATDGDIERVDAFYFDDKPYPSNPRPGAREENDTLSRHAGHACASARP
jgi:hypothetical protein